MSVNFIKGHKHSDEIKEKISIGNKGKIVKNNVRERISNSMKGRIPWNKGKNISPEHKRKIGLNGFHYGMLGKKQSKETIEKRVKNMRGEKSYLWRGGKSFEIYPVDWRITLKRSIRERDKYQCQLCEEQQGDEALSIHHIDYNKQNCNPINLISLCRNCHTKTNHNRDYWINYFKI